MLLIETEVKNSSISGRGLFSRQSVKKGEVVAILTHSCPTMSERQYQNEQEKGNEVIIMTAVRWVGDLFAYGDSIGPEEFINHSFDPSMLYHAGICFATRDIAPGDELTADYRFFLAENDVYRFTDAETGKLVDGLGPKRALADSATALVRLLEDAG